MNAGAIETHEITIVGDFLPDTHENFLQLLDLTLQQFTEHGLYVVTSQAVDYDDDQVA